MKKKKRYEEKKIIIEQMKQKKIKKEQEKLNIKKEGEELKQYLQKLEQEDIIKETQKHLNKINLAKEIVETNKILAQNKSKLLQEERNNDLNLLKYNMELSKKKEEELYQRKILQLKKEQETQKLLLKQEKYTDEQALLDEFRAKRYLDEINRKERDKELKEALKLNEFRKEGCDFVCWNTIPDGSGISYSDGQEIAITSTITLYAQWKAVVWRCFL